MVRLRAVVVSRGSGFSVIETESPRAGAGEIVVRMAACGLCGTDIEKIEGGYVGSPPVIGHEAAGIIEEVGAGVSGLERGDRVVPHHHAPCYSCYYCRSGSPTMCPDYRRYNFVPGGFAEFFKVPAWIVERGGVLRLPDGVGLEEASLTEPTACCLRAIRRIGLRRGESALVVGAGPAGLTHAQLLLRLGASIVMTADKAPPRLRFAERIGSHPIDVSDEAAEGLVSELTEGRGADVAIVATGSPAGLEFALRAVRRGGRVCLFGIPPVNSRLNYDISDLLVREVSIISSNAAVEEDMSEALRLIASGEIDARSMITHRFGIEEFGDALRVAKEGSCIKAVIVPRARGGPS